MEELGILAGLISLRRGFKSRTRHSIRCRSTAGRCPVKAAIGVRIPAPEPWSLSTTVVRHPVKVEGAGSSPVGAAMLSW